MLFSRSQQISLSISVSILSCRAILRSELLRSRIPPPPHNLVSTQYLFPALDYPNHHLPLQHTKTVKMGIIRGTLKLTSIGTAATLGTFFWATRDSTFVPLPVTDHIFQSKLFSKFNPSKNPTTHDLCIRKVPLSEINPALLEKKGKLVEAFCAGVWSGWGMLLVYVLFRSWVHRLWRGVVLM